MYTFRPPKVHKVTPPLTRVEMKAGDLPVELIQKAEVIVHRVRVE